MPEEMLFLNCNRAPACYEGMHTMWNHLFYVTLEILMHKARQKLGLNPNATPFYLLKDYAESQNNAILKDIKENPNQENANNTKTNKIPAEEAITNNIIKETED